MKYIFTILVLLLISVTSSAAVLLPLQTLRDQANTAHCWAYASGHLLESRAQVRESIDFMFETERDVKYWVDFERMLAIYRLKTDVYLDFSYEGAWQIEFLQSLAKHGKHILRSQTGNQAVWYQSRVDYTTGLPYLPVTRNTGGQSYDAETVRVKLLSGGLTEAQALAYIKEVLNNQYGAPTDTTTWFGHPTALTDTARLALGSDFVAEDTLGFVLVRPVDASDVGWGKLLAERFWGYNYDISKILDLVKLSLKNGWPVTYDNVGHAMTIIGYDNNDGVDYFAIADSAPARIKWFNANRMRDDLNLLTFYRASIPDQLPPRTKKFMAKQRKALERRHKTPPGR